MQPLNNDMDELMRKAAAGYPVIPQGADWQKVAQQLNQPGVVARPADYGVLKKLLFLVLFLLAGFVCDRFLIYEYGVLKKFGSANQAISLNEKSAVKQVVEKSGKENKVMRTGRRKNGTGFIIATAQALPGTNFETVNFFKVATREENVRMSNPSEHTPFEKARLETQPQGKLMPKEAVPVSVAASKQMVLAVKPQDIKLSPDKGGDKKANMNAAETFYVTFLGGPDLSHVKAQKMDKAGYSIGILGGYRFAKKWAVEGGVLWDRKNYFSKGEYFKTDNIGLPEHSSVVQVDGFCAMFEIPLNLRYNLVQKKSGVLFASAGLSSYLMHKEDYNYVYRRYNVDYAGNKKYMGVSRDWLSVGNLSAGYEKQLGLKSKIRIEPYLKVPLKGVGIGSLPLTSAGVMIGITHTIH